MAKNNTNKTPNIKPMSKFEKQGQSKVINSYGAVGTLIQTMNNGSLMINNFDQWPYYHKLCAHYVADNQFVINNPALIKEDRLLERLKAILECNTLQGIFRMPTNEFHFATGVKSPQNVISAKLFPRYFFCPRCHQMNYYVSDGQFPYCCGMPKEQFSFVLVSERGLIYDIPWAKFLITDPAVNVIYFNDDDTKATNLNLTYTTGGSAEHLEAKKVTGNINGQNVTRSLASLPIKTFIDSGNIQYKMAIRQGNNLCFVKTVSSIYIPEYQIPGIEKIVLSTTKKIFVDNAIPLSATALLNSLRAQHPDTSTNLDHIHYWIQEQESDANLDVKDDSEYKFKEFDFITSKETYDNPSEDISFNKFEINKWGILNLYRIKKIKVTHVQTGYSRLKPEGNIQSIYSNPNILFYPGVELKGEGVLLQMNTSTLNAFLNNEVFNVRESDIGSMIHSLSHCIMKELEFECGYPLNSLKERLYYGTEEIGGIDQVKYAGILIYSASGSNSSFGGISSLFETINDELKISALIKNAYERAQDCPNDPICISEESNGNKGVCYSCNLIPETSCEFFNESLNRVALNDFYQNYCNDGVE